LLKMSRLDVRHIRVDILQKKMSTRIGWNSELPLFLENLDKSWNSQTVGEKSERFVVSWKIGTFPAFNNALIFPAWRGITVYECSSRKEVLFVCCTLLPKNCREKPVGEFYLPVK